MISWSEERNGVNLSDTYTFKTSNECKIDNNLQSKCMKIGRINENVGTEF